MELEDSNIAETKKMKGHKSNILDEAQQYKESLDRRGVVRKIR